MESWLHITYYAICQFTCSVLEQKLTVQADPAIYYPSSRANRKSVTFFPSPFTPRDHFPSVPWGPGWRLYKRKFSQHVVEYRVNR
jgi:hypothetical protein